MTIIIPSKKIYKLKNPKIIDNIANYIDVGVTKISPNNGHRVAISQTQHTGFSLNSVGGDSSQKDVGVGATRGMGTTLPAQTWGVFSACLYTQYKNSNFDILIPIEQENALVSQVITGDDKSGNHEIGIQLYGTIQKGKAQGTFNYENKYAELVLSKDGTLSFDSYTEEVEKNAINIPSETTHTYIHNISGIADVEENISATSKATLYDTSNLSRATASIVKIDDKEYYSLSLIINTGVTVTKLGRAVILDAIADKGQITLSGEYERYIASDVQITVLGNTLDIKLENGTATYTYGKANKPYSTHRNELVQQGAKTLNKELSQSISDEIHQQYSLGKEKATITCAIGDYFDEDGLLIISTKNEDRMYFENGDIVVPMRYNVGGADEPLSKHTDGSAKKFAVVGNRIYYDGAVWQELYLQEYAESV